MRYSFDAGTVRLLRFAIIPRTPPLDLFDLAAFIYTLLTEAGCSPKRAIDLRDLVHQSMLSHSALANHADSGPVVADGIANAVAAFNPVDSGGWLCCLVLHCQAYKRDRVPTRATSVRRRLRQFPIEKLIGERRVFFLQRRWGRLSAVATAPTQPVLSPVEKKLETAIAGSRDEALRIYDQLINEYVASPLISVKKAIENVVDRLPFRTHVVTRSIAQQGSECRPVTKHYMHLELPLPVLPPTRSAEEILAILRAEFPWLHPACDAIELDLLISRRFKAGVPAIRPLLLLGPAGCGKTTFAQRFGDLLNQQVTTIAAGGATSTRIVSGTARGWGGSRPCLPAELISQHRRAQTVIIVDELEKSGTGSENGRFQDGLLCHLEPSSRVRYYDECLLATCNFSLVTWVATSNTLDSISTPLLSRFSIIECSQPASIHMQAIVDSTLRGMRKDYSVDDDVELVDHQARAELTIQAPLCESARDCAELVRQKIGQSLRRGSLPDALPAVCPSSGVRMH